MDLKNIVGLKQEEIDMLSKNWITTAEEFASISFNKVLSRNLQKLLNVRTSRYTEICQMIIKSLPELKVKEIKEFKNIQNKTGSKKPKK